MKIWDKIENVKNLGLFEILLIQSILYICVWLLDDYIGTLVSLCMAGVFFVVLAFSLLVELIEKSGISKKFYYFLLLSIFTPIFIGMAYYYLFEGNLEWLKSPF